jgi:GNAT superfamily N-acetyltransferase
MIRTVRADDLPALNALILRSKAHWGYDKAFMQAVMAELTLTEAALGPGCVLWEEVGTTRGIARVRVDGRNAELEELFVEPNAMGRGIGAALFTWAIEHARAQGAEVLGLASDPFAETFYLARGAVRVGEVPSGSIPGRTLPRLELRLAAG